MKNIFSMSFFIFIWASAKEIESEIYSKCSYYTIWCDFGIFLLIISPITPRTKWGKNSQKFFILESILRKKADPTTNKKSSNMLTFTSSDVISCYIKIKINNLILPLWPQSSILNQNIWVLCVTKHHLA